MVVRYGRHRLSFNMFVIGILALGLEGIARTQHKDGKWDELSAALTITDAELGTVSNAGVFVRNRRYPEKLVSRLPVEWDVTYGTRPTALGQFPPGLEKATGPPYSATRSCLAKVSTMRIRFRTRCS